MDDHFEAERRRLRQQLQAAIEKIQATYQRRLDAVDRAEELMEFAASAPPEAEAAPDEVVVPIPATGNLRADLTRWVAGRSEPFSLADVEARLPGVAAEQIRTCLAQMAKVGAVSIVEAGEAGQPTRYQVPEPDYGGVPPRERQREA